MTLKIWTNKIDNDVDFTEGRIRDHKPLMRMQLTGGQPLKNIWPKVIIDITSDYTPADSFKSGPLLVACRNMAEAIYRVASEDDVEFLPIDVVFKGQIYEEYGVLNVLNVCDALDKNSSVFTESNGIIDSIDRVRLNESATKGKPIFLLDAIAHLIIVNDAMSACIESGGFTGVALKSESDWRPF